MAKDDSNEEHGDKRVEGVVVLFDDPTPEREQGEGDTPEEGTVVVYEPENVTGPPTAKDLRAMGYDVPKGVKDDEVVSNYAADTPKTNTVVLHDNEATEDAKKQYEDSDVNVTTTAEESRKVNPEGAPVELSTSGDNEAVKRVTKALKKSPSVKKVRTTKADNGA